MYKTIVFVAFFIVASAAAARSKADVEYDAKLSDAILLTTNQCEDQQVVRVQVEGSTRKPVTVVYGQAIKDDDWGDYRFAVENNEVVLQLLESFAEWYKEPQGAPRKVLKTWKRGWVCID